MSNIGQLEAINLTALAYINFSSSDNNHSISYLITTGVIDSEDLGKVELAALSNPNVRSLNYF